MIKISYFYQISSTKDVFPPILKNRTWLSLLMAIAKSLLSLI